MNREKNGYQQILVSCVILRDLASGREEVQGQWDKKGGIMVKKQPWQAGESEASGRLKGASPGCGSSVLH